MGVVVPECFLLAIPQSAFTAFYNYQKRQNPEQTIFYYHAKELSGFEAGIILRPLMSPTMLQAIEQKRDFFGLTSQNTRLVKILNGTSRLTPVSLVDYFEILPILPPDVNIVPYQVITLELEDKKLIFWAGTGNNRYWTSDRYIGGCTMKFEIDTEEEFDLSSGEELEPEVLETFHKELRSQINEENFSLPIRCPNMFPEECFASIWEDSYQPAMDMIIQKQFELYNDRPMSDIYEVKGTGYQQIMNILSHIVNILSGLGYTKSSIGKETYQSVSNKITNSHSSKIGDDKVPATNPNQKKLNWDQVGSLLTDILETQTVTCVNDANIYTDHYCNEAANFDIKIICRFGFAKL